MTHPEAVTKVPCPACVPATQPHCKVCAGDGMVSPEVSSMYLVRRSGEYRLSLKKEGQEDER